METTKRRNFLKAAGLGAAAVSLSSRTARAADGDKLIVGVIGTGGMGTNHTKTLAGRKDVEVAYVCDVDKNRLA
ncbi:MAG: twin-arginine translocation signal domain-containing protein, partial [Planctomycetes bacterium]|nr:twin-arginine translocation signal domain-containing protein [Planctomycetota bacterium]